MVWGNFLCMSLFVANFHSIVSGRCPSAVWGFVQRNSDLKNPHVTISLFYCCHTSGFPNSTHQEVFTGRKIRGGLCIHYAL